MATSSIRCMSSSSSFQIPGKMLINTDQHAMVAFGGYYDCTYDDDSETDGGADSCCW